MRKIKTDCERDIISRLRATDFDDGLLVSTISNGLTRILNPLSDLREQLFPSTPYETAVRDNNEVFVVAHYRTENAARKGHARIVRLLLKNEFDWKVEHKKDFRKYILKRKTEVSEPI